MDIALLENTPEEVPVSECVISSSDLQKNSVHHIILGDARRASLLPKPTGITPVRLALAPTLIYQETPRDPG